MKTIEGHCECRSQTLRALAHTSNPLTPSHAATDTGHFKSVVTKPQNVFVMRDIACAGYVAGGNTEFFSKTGDLGAAAQAIQDRLSFVDGPMERYKSMLAFPMWEKQMEGTSMDTVMSVTSRLLPWEVQVNAPKHDSFPGGEAMYVWYEQQLNLKSIHFGEDMKAAENMEFISQARYTLHSKPQTRRPTDASRSSDVRRVQRTTPYVSWARRARTTPWSSRTSC